MSDQVIAAPGGFVPAQALAFGADGAIATPVDAAHPLPTRATMTAAQSTPLAGATAATVTVGPFVPELNRAIVVTLAGTWTGTGQLLRSTDGGATKLPVTIGGAVWASYAASCNEQAWTETDAAATFYLALAPTSGTVSYRVAQ